MGFEVTQITISELLSLHDAFLPLSQIQLLFLAGPFSSLWLPWRFICAAVEVGYEHFFQLANAYLLCLYHQHLRMLFIVHSVSTYNT
jgi:hypothetical protein